MHLRLADATEFAFPKTEVFSAPMALVFGAPDHGEKLADLIVNLWLEGRFKKIVFSGYQGEAEFMSSAAMKAGLPRESIVLEKTASNTPENVALSMPYLCENDLPPGKLVAFGKNWAARRCLMTLKKYLPDCKISFVGIDYCHVTSANWFRHEGFVHYTKIQMKKCADYHEWGHISSLSADDKFTPAYLRELHNWMEDFSDNMKGMNSRLACIEAAPRTDWAELRI